MASVFLLCISGVEKGSQCFPIFLYVLLDCILPVVWVVGIVACPFQLYLLLHVLDH